MKPLFELGKVNVTQAAEYYLRQVMKEQPAYNEGLCTAEELAIQLLLGLLQRHQSGDYGDVKETTVFQNRQSVCKHMGGSIKSCYKVEFFGATEITIGIQTDKLPATHMPINNSTIVFYIRPDETFRGYSDS